MTIAVLISGQLRSAAACIESTRRHVLEPLQRLGHCDIFCHVGSDADPAPLSAYAPREVVVADPPDFDPTPYLRRGAEPHPTADDIRRLLVQFWRLEQSNRLKKRAETALARRYDWVVRLRTDSLYFTDIEDLASLDSRAIYLPTFGNYWGYNDRFAYGGSEAMDRYHDKLGAPLDAALSAGARFHPESLLRAILDRAAIPVRRSGIIFDTLRKDGTRLTLTWAAEYGDILPDFLPDWRRQSA